MPAPISNPTHDDIARIAQAIWEREGRPEGKDHEHWTRARGLIEDGQVEAEFPEAVAGSTNPDTQPAARPVQPGFQDAAPGLVPNQKGAAQAASELREGPGGRFAKQIVDSPAVATVASDTPGPRNPRPIPAANSKGYVAIPSDDDNAAAALRDSPTPPPAKSR